MKAGTTKILSLFLLTLLAGSLLTACGGGGSDADQPPKTVMVDMGEFTTNVLDSKKLLSCGIKIDITDEKMAPDFADRDYVAKDAIVRILRELTEADLTKEGIQDELSGQILEALNSAYETECVYRVYFVRFVYQ